MASWWLDESSPYPGPYEEPTFSQVFETLSHTIEGLTLVSKSMFTMIDKFNTKVEVGITEAESILGFKGYQSDYALIKEFITADYTETPKTKEKLALESADKALKVPIGTNERLKKFFGEISEADKKRQIGRGFVAGKGPRGKTTFKHNGKRCY